MAASLRCGIHQSGKSHASGEDDGSRRAGDGSGADPVVEDEDYWLGLWAFGTARDGLALSADELWQLTPREFGALTKVWRDARKPQQWYYAGLQATLHNAWLRGENKPAWTAHDWLPEDERPKPNPVQALQHETDKKYMLRSILFDAAAQLAAAKHDPEMEAQLDALQAKDWAGGTVN